MSDRMSICSTPDPEQSVPKSSYVLHKFAYYSKPFDMHAIKRVIMKRYRLVRLSLLINGHQQKEVLIVGNRIIHVTGIGYISNETTIIIGLNRITFFVPHPRIVLSFAMDRMIEFKVGHTHYKNILAIGRFYA